MLGLTAFGLFRIQFGFTISYRIVFPAISIGIATCRTALEARWLRIGQRYHAQIKGKSIPIALQISSK